MVMVKLWHILTTAAVAGGLALLVGVGANQKHQLDTNLQQRAQELNMEYPGIPMEGNAVRTVKIDGKYISSFNTMFQHCIGQGSYGVGWEDYQTALQNENPGIDLNKKVHKGETYKAPVSMYADRYCGKDIQQ